MASVEEVVAIIQQAQQQVANGVSACSNALAKATQLQQQLAAAGVRDKVAQLNVAKAEIEKFRTHIASSNELSNNSINATKAVSGSG
jgi:hypothetical protein